MALKMSAFQKAVVLRRKICVGASEYTKACENFVRVLNRIYLG